MPLSGTLSTCGWLQEGRNQHIPSLRLAILGMAYVNVNMNAIHMCKMNGIQTL